MVVFVNGAFGVGKTTVSRLLVGQLAGVPRTCFHRLARRASGRGGSDPPDTGFAPESGRRALRIHVASVISHRVVPRGLVFERG